MSMRSTVHTAPGLALDLLRAVAGRATGADPERAPDWGVPALARLVAPAGDRSAVRSAVLAWAAQHGRGATHPGVHGGGLAGCTAGLAHAAEVEPRLRPAAALAAQRLADQAGRGDLGGGRVAAVTMSDYDLISGAAGVTAVLAAVPAGPPAAVAALARQLAGRCGSDDLSGLGIGDARGIPESRWTVGTVNLGLAHGAPGVLAGLVAAWPRLVAGTDRAELAPAIRRVAGYLVRHRCRDNGGLVGWPFGVSPTRPPGGDAADGWPSAEIEQRRQAWCYGTPGVAWQLAEAGRVLGDRDLREAGVSAMASLCARWDDDRHLLASTATERLAFCHGAAGVLAVADAFALHTGLKAARRLGDHLARLLTAELDQVAELAETDLSTISGATGILAVLLSRTPERRGWLRPLALR